MFPLNFPSNYLQVYKSKDSNLFKILLKLNTLDFLGKFGKLQIQKKKTWLLKPFSRNETEVLSSMLSIYAFEECPANYNRLLVTS